MTAVVLVPTDLVTAEPPAGPDPTAPGFAPSTPHRPTGTARRSTVPRPRGGRTRPTTALSAADAQAPPTGTPAPVAPPASGSGAGGPLSSGSGAGGPLSNGATDGEGVTEPIPTADPSTDELDGLPRRVRRRPPAATPRSAAVDTPSPRSPEEVRRVMSALQAGTARGRATVVTPPAPANPAAPPRPSSPAASAMPAAPQSPASPPSPASPAAPAMPAAPPSPASPTTDPGPATTPETLTATERDA
ncbi:hypothetical protein GCM10027614_34360 [Micromonospora vulcania]